MNPKSNLVQTPAPGGHVCRVQGDTLEIILKTDSPLTGTAWLRTNIGHATRMRAERIAHVEDSSPILARDWFDIPMHRETNSLYTILLGLSEVGHFQAKSFLLPDNATEPLWPDGENLVINVEPADTCCGNTLYNAFTRLLAPTKTA